MRPFEIRFAPEPVEPRRVLFAVEVLDAVTLQRVSQGVTVEAEGLRGKPIVNAGGVFVWLREEIGALRKVTINPGFLPYEPAEVLALDLKRPLTTVQLAPLTSYPFDAGVTGLLGTLIEERVPAPGVPVPAGGARMRLRWVDEDGIWHDAPTDSRSSSATGDFAAILRLAPAEAPPLDAAGLITVRLRAERGALGTRDSGDFTLTPGRVTEPNSTDQLLFAWDAMHP